METAIGWPGCDFDERRHTAATHPAASARGVAEGGDSYHHRGIHGRGAAAVRSVSGARRNSIFVHIKINYIRLQRTRDALELQTASVSPPMDRRHEAA